MKFTLKKYDPLFNLSVSAVLILFTLNLLINFFTVHTHVLADGTRVTHSHFSTNDSPNGSSENHSHTAEELESSYLASFSKIGNLDNSIISIILLLLFLSFITETVRKHQLCFTESPSLRGPPPIIYS